VDHFIEGLGRLPPRLLRAVVDTAQRQHRALRRLAVSAAFILDDVPVAMHIASISDSSAFWRLIVAKKFALENKSLSTLRPA
jgi:hypothetical protein